MIGNALELSERHEAFARRAEGLSDAEFTAAWERFVQDNQLLL